MAGSLTGSFTATGDSEEVALSKLNFNVGISGTFVATVILQRSFDGGTTWFSVETFTNIFQGIGIEVESEVKYKFVCTAFTSGQVDYRLGLKRF